MKTIKRVLKSYHFWVWFVWILSIVFVDRYMNYLDKQPQWYFLNFCDQMEVYFLWIAFTALFLGSYSLFAIDD